MTPSLFPRHRAPALLAAVERLAGADDTDRGAIYTRSEIVRSMLDLMGYRPELPLFQKRLLEPSFGGGDFLLPALDRLLASFARAGKGPAQLLELEGALRGVEIHRAAFETTREALLQRLLAWGCVLPTAIQLLDVWLLRDDFLQADLGEDFDFVIGNPPYVRQERIPEPLLAEYRRRYKTIYDRADLYVPFFEAGLRSLAPGGCLAFICANRWLKNKYGGPLRELAASRYHLRYFIDLEGSPAFHSEVIAYPAITVFERAGSGAATRIARKPEVSERSLERLVAAMLNGGPASDSRVEELEQAVRGSDPWLLDDPEHLRLIRHLERSFPTLEEAGCKVGIGVATGADRIFIGALDTLPVEAERKLPLAMAGDLDQDQLRWGGMGVVNPFNPDGSLASFEQYPRFGAYMRLHQTLIAARHCAQKPGGGWYRTIDRIWPELTGKPKLLIPDIKGEPTVVLDPGGFYPHHNLYYVLSEDWDLTALAVLLRSSVAVLFISSYSVRMSGGFLRFQAQYLRRIHVPRWATLSAGQRGALLQAGRSMDIGEIDRAVAMAYGLSSMQAELVRRIANEARVPRKNHDRAAPSH